MSGRRGSWKNKKKKREVQTPAEPDTSAPIGHADLKHKDVSIYLVKMPTMLAEQFEVQPGDEKAVIGRLRIPSNVPAGAKSEDGPRILLDEVRATKTMPKKNVVTNYDLEFQQEDAKVMVFSQNRKGEDPDVRMEGKVSFHCLARPKLDAKYRGVSKRRTAESNTKNRAMILMEDSDRRAVDRDALEPLAMTETTKEREERKKKKEDARRHLDVPDEEYRENARIAVFKAFEIQAHYTAEELSRVTATPLPRLRSVISEVCAYNKSGPFAGRYDLKDEFKTLAQRQQKDREREVYEQEQLEMVKKRREDRAEKEKDLPPSKKSRLN